MFCSRSEGREVEPPRDTLETFTVVTFDGVVRVPEPLLLQV